MSIIIFIGGVMLCGIGHWLIGALLIGYAVFK